MTKVPVVAKGVERTHSANKCTNSMSHSHLNGGATHSHHYNCNVKTRNISANAHTHPANSLTRSILHSHPNGKNAHKHYYGEKKTIMAK